jgi:hypothetical protein
MASKRSPEGDYNSKDYPPVPPSNGGGSGGSGKPPRNKNAENLYTNDVIKKNYSYIYFTKT